MRGLRRATSFQSGLTACFINYEYTSKHEFSVSLRKEYDSKNYTANHQLAQMHIKTQPQNPSVEASSLHLYEIGIPIKKGQQLLPFSDLQVSGTSRVEGVA